MPANQWKFNPTIRRFVLFPSSTCHLFHFSTVKCPHQPISGLSINAFCNHQGQELNCTGDQLPGTEASIECHFGYQMPPTAADLKLTCLTTGNWSHEALKCEPICGKITSHSTSLFINGQFIRLLESVAYSFTCRQERERDGGAVARGNSRERRADLRRDDRHGTCGHHGRSLFLPRDNVCSHI